MNFVTDVELIEELSFPVYRRVAQLDHGARTERRHGEINVSRTR